MTLWESLESTVSLIWSNGLGFLGAALVVVSLPLARLVLARGRRNRAIDAVLFLALGWGVAAVGVVLFGTALYTAGLVQVGTYLALPVTIFPLFFASMAMDSFRFSGHRRTD